MKRTWPLGNQRISGASTLCLCGFAPQLMELQAKEEESPDPLSRKQMRSNLTRAPLGAQILTGTANYRHDPNSCRITGY